MVEPLRLFCCYARNDEKDLQNLKNQLMSLQREGLIDIKSDIDISPGQEWERAIHHYLEQAQIILFLITPNFIASDYCYNIEMKKAIARHDQGTACVIPVIIRPCFWEQLPFRRLQALPKNATPVTSWQNSDEAYTSIVAGIRKAICEFPFIVYNQVGPATPPLKSCPVCSAAIAASAVICPNCHNNLININHPAVGAFVPQPLAASQQQYPQQVAGQGSAVVSPPVPITSSSSSQGKLLCTYKIVPGSPIIWSPNESLMALSPALLRKGGVKVQFWNTKVRGNSYAFPYGPQSPAAPFMDGVISPDCTRVAVAGSTEESAGWTPRGGNRHALPRIEIWDIQEKRNVPLLSLNTPNPIQSIAWSPDGTKLASVSSPYSSAEVLIWDAQRVADPLYALLSKSEVSTIHASRPGLLDPLSEQTAPYEYGNTGDFVNWSSDGNWLIVQGRPPYRSSGTILEIWNVQRGGSSFLWFHLQSGGTWNYYEYDKPKNLGKSSVLSPDRTKIALFTSNAIEIWDLNIQKGTALGPDTYEIVPRFRYECSYEVNAVAWSPDSTRIASGGHSISHSDYSLLEVWDAQREGVGRNSLFTCKGVTVPYSRAYVYAAAWSPDGTQIVSALRGWEDDKEQALIHVWQA